MTSPLSKPRMNDKGQLDLVLPVSGLRVRLQQPKTKHLKQVQNVAKNNGTDLEVLAYLMAVLSLEGEGLTHLTPEAIDELDANDFEAVTEGITTCFPYFNKSR